MTQITENHLREIVLKHFKPFSVSFEFINIVCSVLERIDDLTTCNEDEIYDAINDEIIYYTDQWEILKNYCFPQDANWEQAMEEFTNDLFEIVSEYTEAKQND